jgi:hypothetical protein
MLRGGPRDAPTWAWVVDAPTTHATLSESEMGKTIACVCVCMRARVFVLYVKLH